MKSCLASTRVSWIRKRVNGEKSTRSVRRRIEAVFTTHPTGYIGQALQLLEYIIKHGSERVVDDARSHLSTIKMLRNFHYIDDKGKDQGINGIRRIIFFSEDVLTLVACHSAQPCKGAR